MEPQSTVPFTKIPLPPFPGANVANLYYDQSNAKLTAMDENGNKAIVADFSGGSGSGGYKLSKITNVANGTATYATGAACRALFVEAIGAGGAGGGVVNLTSASGGGGGGGGGGYSSKWITGSIQSTTYQCQGGTGGTAGSAGNNAGNAGADSYFGSAFNNIQVCAKGGSGGSGDPGHTTINNGGAGGAGGVATGGTVNEVHSLPFVDTSGSGTFLITVEGLATAAITYNATPATVIASINTALNAAYGTSAIVCSGTTLANIILTFSGTGYTHRPIGTVTATVLAGSTGYTINGSGTVGTPSTAVQTTQGSTGPLGDTILSGAPGTNGLTLAATLALAGTGGDGSIGGGGGAGTGVQGAGAAATGLGAGGAGGAMINAGASVAGGAGGNGWLRVWEFE